MSGFEDLKNLQIQPDKLINFQFLKLIYLQITFVHLYIFKSAYFQIFKL